MIEIRKMDINSDDARMLIHELNCVLERITGDNGTGHFCQTDVEQERSVFLVGYIDEMPYACGALKKVTCSCGEIKRVYARENSCGMGSRILEALEKEAKSYNYQTLVLETRIQNKRAIAFYEKNGYIHCPNYGVYLGEQNSYCFTKDL